MFASFFVSRVDSKMDFPTKSSTATLRSRLSCVNYPTLAQLARMGQPPTATALRFSDS
jgi:hypothetical protein